MEKVLIEIIGSQNIDNQFDKTEFKTVGTFEELEEKYVIRAGCRRGAYQCKRSCFKR